MTKAPDRVSVAAFPRLFLDRWSPRSFDPTPIAEEELLGFLEAGSWAPSAYNSQPWRFIHARRDTPHWDRFLSWLIPFNQSWAKNASALVYVASRTVMQAPGKTETTPAGTHAYDAGAASMLVALAVADKGWASHSMSGFDPVAAREGMGLPEEFALNAVMAIGKQGPAEALPEMLQAREMPSDRLPLADIAWQGGFPG